MSLRTNYSPPSFRWIPFRRAVLAIFAALLAVPIAAALLSRVPRPPAQQTSDVPREEIVANLAAGRVVIAVVKDGIIVGTIENPMEAGTRPPTPVPISSERTGIILGAVEWLSPATQRDIVRLDRDLPHARDQFTGGGPHLGQVQPHGASGSEATDIEQIGHGLLQDINQVAQILHGKLDLPENEPLAEMIVADYLAGYGPEVWQATYRIEQEQQQGDYWATRVLRPAYLQFWPPEKKQPRTLVEFYYPPEDAPPALLDLLKQKDPRIEKIIDSDAAMADISLQLLQGESTKLKAADTIQFLRAALDAIAPPKARETMAVIKPEAGFSWILPPPPEPLTPAQQEQRPAGAPSLAHPPSS